MSLTSYYKARVLFSIAVFAFIVMVFSVHACYIETKYALFGRTAAASVLSVEERSSRSRGRTSTSLVVKYSFTDAGDTRREEDEMPGDWPPPAAGGTSSIQVQYIPGKLDWSRVDGHNRLWLTVPLLLSVAAVAGFFGYFYIDYRNHERRKASWDET